ncbi:MAG: carbon-nitrogen hydrolase family protein [Phycisphaeraceae bacterium]|nr:carbon-nitrogen hydrolase family protein [Phycisphaeraceae bacterium]
MRPFAIAGLQLKISGRRSNLEHITDRIEMVMHLYPWVQMVVVSELATFGGWTGHALALPGEVEQHYQRLAARHGIWLLPGSLYEQTPDGIYNTTPVIDPSGAVIARYRKMFPFLPYEQGVRSGTEFCVFDIPEIGRFGVSICYDMWFPETSRTLAAMGAEVILHPTLTPTMDRDVELAIARATAATNQCFVVDINGIGDGGNGRSIMVAPTGDVLYQAGSHEELLPIEIDLDRVRRSREVGLKGLGQPLKSFRDRAVDFDVYRRGTPLTAYLDTLGSLEKMARGSKAGIGFGQHHPHAMPPLPAPTLPQTTPPPPTVEPAP